MKNIIKDTIFLSILIVLLIICSNIFVLKGNGYGSDITSFYRLPKNSLDIIFFGSSHSYSSFSPNIIEQKSGLKSYNFATQQQPIQITYHYMIEALKTQQPKYFVLESHMLTIDYDYAEEGTVRDAIDKLNFSVNKINAINVSVKDPSDRYSYHFNIIKYHSRYKDLNLNDIKEGILQKGIQNNGFIALESNFDVEVDNQEIIKNSSKKELYYKNIDYLNRILELAKSNNIELIIVKTPCQMTEERQEKINWLEEFSRVNKIDFIDYNKLFDELELKVGDFFDNGHLSGTGSEKVSNHISNFIVAKKER